RELRRRSGCRFYDRRRDVKAMLGDLRAGGIVLGLLSDQHAGRSGARIPFFGHECSTTTAPAKLALRYKLPLFTAVCFRVGLGRWRIELSEEIATRIGSHSRPTAEIMADVNAAFETAIRRDIPNSFWVYDRWRFAKAARASSRDARRLSSRNKSSFFPRT
ncbi:MAG TPA: lysophospholipid acyltransferase family protein, partial [Burkholderiales bacterium]|nr:lysophospholipid acyltransferase family protein [Burkholderiales bacterium]